MFTKKPEPGESVDEIGGAAERRVQVPLHRASGDLCRQGPEPSGDQDGALDHRRGSYHYRQCQFQRRDPGRRRNQGRLHCGSLLLGDKSTVTGSVTAEDVVVRGKVIGAVRGLRVTLQAQSHVEGDIYHQSLAIEQGAYFEGKSRRSDDPLERGSQSKPSTVADKTPRFEANP